MITMPQVKYQVVPLKGGLDLITPTLSLPPGVIRDSMNFECSLTGGYSRVGGYERVDGRPSPSSATYSIVQVASFTNTPTAGQVITQAVSGATGVVVFVGANFMVVTKVTTGFDFTHAITTPGPVAIGTATLNTVIPTAIEDAQYMNLAADSYRSDILAVPGSGPVRGVVMATFAGVDHIYAFRDNAGGTAVDLYKASATGWTQIPFYNEVGFNTGSAATPADGATLTQGGVTATVKRVVAQSGAWSGSAAGRLIITNPSGGNFAAGAATLTGGATVTLTGVQTAITLTPGGKFEFANGNFSGQLGTLRIYGCDGVNRAIEFDGTTLVPITTGVTPDSPKHVAVHKNYLFLSVQSSIFYSGPGLPFRWLQADGGGEIATGDTVTGFLVLPGNQTTGTLAVFGRSNTFMLYGTGATSWNFVPFNTGTGGLDYTGQNMAQSYVLDDRGVISLQTTLAFGNFAATTLTNNIKPFILDKRTKVAYSTLMREKNQYRLFFNDGYGLYLTINNGEFMGAMPVYFPNTVYSAWEGEASNGSEVSYFGADTGGFVYQLDVGSSFDGVSIDAFFTLVWDAIGSPRILKRLRHASLEMQGSSYASIAFGYQLGYGSSEIDQPGYVAYESGFQRAPSWDSLTWDNFVWDGRTLAPTEVDVTGTAENIQITISSASDYIMPYTINSIITHYTPRRALR